MGLQFLINYLRTISSFISDFISYYDDVFIQRREEKKEEKRGKRIPIVPFHCNLIFE